MNMFHVEVVKSGFKGYQQLCSVPHPTVEGATLSYFDFDDENLLGVIGPQGSQIFNPKTSHLHMGDKLIRYMDVGDAEIFTNINVRKRQRRKPKLEVHSNETPEQCAKRVRPKLRIVTSETEDEKPKRRQRSKLEVPTEVRGRSRRVRSKLDQKEPLESGSTTSRTRRRSSRSVLRVPKD